MCTGRFVRPERLSFYYSRKKEEREKAKKKEERNLQPSAAKNFPLKEKKSFYHISLSQPAKLLYVQSNVHIFHRQWEMMSHWKVSSWVREPSNAPDSEPARAGADLRYGYALITHRPCSARAFAEFLLSSPFSNLQKMCNLKEVELKSLCSL